ncbi:MAG: hypothetical protein ACYTHJ_19660 [Planctomycetota bacterium]|jgi:hypothetical protein
MFEVTGAALSRLSKKLCVKKAEEDETFRFVRKKGGWKLSLDRAHPDDKAFRCAGKDVLVLDPAVTKAMDALILDVRSTEKGERLKLRRTRPKDA